MKKNKNIVIGYTQGTFDTLHYGHIKLFENAKKRCDYLIVGINSDELVKNYKNITPVFNEKQRVKFVSSIKYVDKVVIVNDLDKLSKAKKYKFDLCFIGSDWKGNERWKETEKQLKKVNVKVVYLPHTDGISSTLIRSKS